MNGGVFCVELMVDGDVGSLSTRVTEGSGWRGLGFGTGVLAWSLTLLLVRMSETNGMGLGLSKRLPLMSLVLSVSKSS